MLGLRLPDFSRALALCLGSLFQANANVGSSADVNEAEIVIRDLLRPDDVRSDREYDLSFLALFVFLGEEIP